MITYLQFQSGLLHALEELQVPFERKQVTKNNDTALDALIFLREESGPMPTLYIQDLYRSYQDGNSMQQIITQIQTVLFKEKVSLPFEPDQFMDYASVKEQLTIRLINRQQNQILLKNIPYLEFLDLAKVVCYILPDDPSASIMINHTHLSIWEISEDQLFYDAHVSMLRLNRPVLTSLSSLPYFADLGDDTLPLYLLTDETGIYGASSILIASVLKRFSGICNEDFFILPSSIHEVLLLTKSVAPQADHIRDMIYEINREILDPQDVLSDQLYYYDIDSETIRIY